MVSPQLRNSLALSLGGAALGAFFLLTIGAPRYSEHEINQMLELADEMGIEVIEGPDNTYKVVSLDEDLSVSIMRTVANRSSRENLAVI